jgi:hypothetical protein
MMWLALTLGLARQTDRSTASSTADLIGSKEAAARVYTRTSTSAPTSTR